MDGALCQCWIDKPGHDHSQHATPLLHRGASSKNAGMTHKDSLEQLCCKSCNDTISRNNFYLERLGYGRDYHRKVVQLCPALQLKRLKLLAVCSSRPLPACLGELAALTYLSLSPIKRVDRCGGQCRLFTSLRMLLPQLSRLQHLDMSLHTDAESVWSIRRRTPGLVVRCHTGLTELSSHCNTVSAV